MWAKYYQSQNERALTVTNDFQEDLDIDSPEDFRAAEQIASGRRARTVPLKEHRVGDWVFTIPEGVDLQSFINFIGPEKLESIEHPIMIAKLIKHEFASSLRLLEVFGRQMFACAEAYAYIVQMNVADPGANSQDMPKQYTASKYYRAHRLPETYSVFTNRRDCAAYDHHGIEFAVENVHTFSNKPVAMPRPGCALAADTLAWDRVIMEEDLKKQAFYVDPIRFEDPEGNGDSFHKNVA